MRYQGGKSRIAKPIAQIIMQAAGGDCFVSLFCGSCAVESKVQGFSRKILNDRHEYLIAMLQGVQQGYNLPEHITPEQYRYIRENKDADPPYNNTTGYAGDRFDTTEFWIAMRLLADLGHTVFVSEQEAPPDIQCIWEKPFTRTLDRNKGNQFTVTEKLFYLPPRRYTQHENGQSGILPK